jgi:hypothetical protein
MLRHIVRSRSAPERRDGGGRLVRILAAVGVGALVVALVSGRIVDLPDWVDGGRSDPAPRGSVTYEGQEARTASERLLVDIGDGEAVVSVKAKQNHDSNGWWINGDFQSTNGTSSVSDPEDGDAPARLAVSVDYCADGLVTTEATEGGDNGSDRVVTAVRFDMGELYVCDTTLEHTGANDAAFRQDDTPRDFHGAFVSFVARAAEVTAAAAACPVEELDEFRTDDYTAFVRDRLADRYGLAASDVEVAAGEIGASDEATRDELRAALDSVTSLQDPDDPSVRHEALSIQYLAGDGEAVTDACYLDPGDRDLDDLGSPEA